MKLKIIIVNFNSGVLLQQCLDALVRQSVQPQHILVIDNASIDGSLARLTAMQPFYRNLEVIALTRNMGFAAANNLAIRSAQDADWVALLNPDAFAEPTWLAEMIAAIQANPEYTFFASRMLVHADPELLDGAGDAYHISGLVWRIGHGQHWRKTGNRPMEVFSACAGAACYRRDALLAVGGFDEDFFCYLEDVDLGFRLRLAGHRCLYVPSAVVRHVGAATSGGTGSDFTLYHGHRNLVWTYIKNMPGALFWVLLPLHLLLNGVSLCWFIYHGKGRIIFKAKLDAVKKIPVMWQKRRLIQRQRLVSIKNIFRLLDKRFFHFKKCESKIKSYCHKK